MKEYLTFNNMQKLRMLIINPEILLEIRLKFSSLLRKIRCKVILKMTQFLWEMKRHNN